MSAPIIEARQVSRWYGLVMGLNHISFDILPGITGLTAHASVLMGDGRVLIAGGAIPSGGPGGASTTAAAFLPIYLA